MTIYRRPARHQVLTGKGEERHEVEQKCHSFICLLNVYLQDAKKKKKVVSSFEENNKHRHKNQQHDGINTRIRVCWGSAEKVPPQGAGEDFAEEVTLKLDLAG